MGWIHYLANKRDEKELTEYLSGCGFGKTSRIGAREFIKAANELKEKDNEMQSLRVQRLDKIQSKEKNSVPTFRTNRQNKKNTKKRNK
jgi:hypothetical protein|tara:strand:- start:35 stop:298 length:264 start_codon:yes stop_codon:yes gene_type:complete